MRAWLETASFMETFIACTVLTAVLTLLGVASGYAAEWAGGRAGPKIFAVPLKRGQLRTEILGTVLFHAVFVPPMAWALHAHWLVFSDGWLAQLLPMPALWVTFQIYYYVYHRAAHHKRLFWVHRWHHESLVTTPWTGFSMHPIEAVAWVVGILGPAIVLGRLGLLGFGGALFYFSVLWIGNENGHANADFMASTKLTSWFAVPVLYHSLHHARFDGHYSFASSYMDRLFGTMWPDWWSLHEKVRAGSPMKSLREKGDQGEGERASPSTSSEAA